MAIDFKLIFKFFLVLIFVHLITAGNGDKTTKTKTIKKTTRKIVKSPTMDEKFEEYKVILFWHVGKNVS
jgi:hypothetical protein